MTLPKIETPTFDVKLKSTGSKITLRPMKMKEEKILLMAKQSEAQEDILKSVVQIVNNCILTEGADVRSLPMYDLELLFLKLRSQSVSNVAKASYRDSEDDKVYDLDVDLDSVELKEADKKVDRTVKFGDLALQLRSPPVSMYLAEDFFKLEGDALIDRLIINSIDKVFKGETGYPVSDQPLEEVQAFVNDLPATSYKAIQDYLRNQPSLYKKLSYKNSKGTERIIELTTLDDFFIFV